MNKPWNNLQVTECRKHSINDVLLYSLPSRRSPSSPDGHGKVVEGYFRLIVYPAKDAVKRDDSAAHVDLVNPRDSD